MNKLRQRFTLIPATLTLALLAACGGPDVAPSSTAGLVTYPPIVATHANAAKPSRLLSIKNVDVVDATVPAYIGQKVRRELWVHVWTFVDLGETTSALQIVDTGGGAWPVAEEPARRVGREENGLGYFVYRIRMVPATNEAHALYAQLDYQGRRHYSNEGRPWERFELPSYR